MFVVRIGPKGYSFMQKLCKLHVKGTIDSFSLWLYYPFTLNTNPYFKKETFDYRVLKNCTQN